jgi:hypothetical protein
MWIQFDNLTGSIEESADFGGDGVICKWRLKIFELLTPVCTENLIPVAARQNHLPSERDDRPDVLLPSAIRLTPQVENPA